MQSEAELRSLLSRIDHRGYPAYKDTKRTVPISGICFIDRSRTGRSVCVTVKGKCTGEWKDSRIPTGIILWKMSENRTSG
mgnify:FL=1